MGSASGCSAGGYTRLSEREVGTLQVEEANLRNSKQKVMVVDSLYGNHIFLAIFLVVKHAYALVRLRSNLVFYERPKPHLKGAKRAPAKHGTKFNLSKPSRTPDRADTFLLGEQTVKLAAWQGLHFKKQSALVGMVLRIEFLRPDGTPRYKRPMWLFWTGLETVPLEELCRMYLWRFAIEHLFRFLKQQMGLNTNQSTDLVSTDHWMWLCALAYWQLLVMREEVNVSRLAWYPAGTKPETKGLTPGQVQRSPIGYLVQLGSPARNTRKSGKGKGRSAGYHPAARTRFPVIKKAKNLQNRAASTVWSLFLETFSVYKVQTLFRRFFRISKVKK